jgi:hypothetical protein
MNKKAVSDMVSYVLLIVIAMSIATGVFAWMKFYMPSAGESQKCSADTALVIQDYSCADKILTVIVENKGYFTINGFFLRASNDSAKLPIKMLPTIDPWAGITLNKGRYDFPEKLKPGQVNVTRFDYNNELDSVKRIQIQPFLLGKKGELLTCPTIADINIDGC